MYLLKYVRNNDKTRTYCVQGRKNIKRYTREIINRFRSERLRVIIIHFKLSFIIFFFSPPCSTLHYSPVNDRKSVNTDRLKISFSSLLLRIDVVNFTPDTSSGRLYLCGRPYTCSVGHYIDETDTSRITNTIF